MWYESLNPNVVESLKAIATSMHMRSLRDYENLEAFLAWVADGKPTNMHGGIVMSRNEVLMILKTMSFVDGFLYSTPNCDHVVEVSQASIDLLTDKLK